MNENSSLGPKVCRIVFCIYAIYMLTGAAMPFQTLDPKDEKASSNTVNQVVDSVIPLTCLICLWPKRRNVLEILKREKYLVAFLVWCAVSVTWSGFPFNSAKASVRLIGSTLVALAFLVNTESPREILKYFKIILAIYIPLTFLSIALVPAATQWEWPAWRGLAPHKNTLGEIALVSTMVWASGIRRESIKRSLGCALLAAASLALMIGSKSITCLITVGFIACVAFWFYASRRFGRAICTAAVGCCFALALLIVVNTGGMDAVFGDISRDASFSGRTEIWDFVLNEVKAHPWQGTGFAAFWTAGNDVRVYPKGVSEYRPGEGHEGYLDLLNETGAIGVGLLALMIVFYFKNAARLDTDSMLWHWLFISALLVNTMESTLFRVASFTGWIFVLSYLSVYVESLPQEETKSLPVQSPSAARAA
jgi:O-antigen ligase